MMRSSLRTAIVLALALEVTLPTAKAETIECRARPETREYWSWREIDGRRCWFKGHRSISKKLLSWGPRKPAEADRVREHPEALVSSIGSFDTAWRNLTADMKSQDRAIRAVRVLRIDPRPTRPER